ncbi:testis-specific zinc finger protein topi-like [Battus philenor]|uniref:testis-specific zinc finger protein topi-like n=1 Tax=Battus philenor TaxID=42288 RepID=UPI0035CFFA26
MASGSELRCIDLDSCSKEISNNGKYSDETQDVTEYNIHCNETSKVIKILPTFFSHKSTETQGNFPKNLTESKTDNSYDASYHISPLEYSLEKVKENNARIMENIHMLNRTLNYTKKKEILNVIWPCSKSMTTHPCNVCGKHFVYVTGLKRHYAMRHVMAEPQQQWQVVWTCTECFQVWPRQDLALNHSDHCGKEEKSDCICEMKTSSLLQCEFCEKVFTSIPRLLRHSKVHTITSNYECNTCKISFLSYKGAEQHWLFCPWLNICYRFSLPKLLLCNVCDRKFRNYEQLYNHRYKVGHFFAKLKTEYNSKCYLVYQCEVCGEWFQTVHILQAHRNHLHPYCDSSILCKSDSFKA